MFSNLFTAEHRAGDVMRRISTNNNLVCLPCRVYWCLFRISCHLTCFDSGNRFLLSVTTNFYSKLNNNKLNNKLNRKSHLHLFKGLPSIVRFVIETLHSIHSSASDTFLFLSAFSSILHMPPIGLHLVFPHLFAHLSSFPWFHSLTWFTPCSHANMFLGQT